MVQSSRLRWLPHQRLSVCSTLLYCIVSYVRENILIFTAVTHLNIGECNCADVLALSLY